MFSAADSKCHDNTCSSGHDSHIPVYCTFDAVRWISFAHFNVLIYSKRKSFGDHTYIRLQEVLISCLFPLTITRFSNIQLTVVFGLLKGTFPLAIPIEICFRTFTKIDFVFRQNGFVNPTEIFPIVILLPFSITIFAYLRFFLVCIGFRSNV